ncbi:MAG: hypothetical protein Q8O90_08940, partial [Elusimicrobiota bacterium]|nr:hypothetical protein [Elusimicrobiota bacterium]
RNHRLGLHDMAMIKDNHVALAGGSPVKLAGRIAAMRKAKPGLKIEIEAQGLDQVKAFLPLGADVLMLDNMNFAAMKKAIALVRAYKGKRPEIELSGGVDLAKAALYSRLGADRISVGSITSGAKPLDISFEVIPNPASGFPAKRVEDKRYARQSERVYSSRRAPAMRAENFS